MMLFEQPREPPTTSMAPASDVAPFDYPGMPLDVPSAEPNEKLARVIAAAHTAAQYDGISAGRINAVTDAYDARNSAIAQATGIKLNNPFRDGYYDEAFARWRAENQFVPPHPPDISDVQAQKSRLTEIQHAIWQERLRQAASSNPQFADLIGPDRPISADAIQLANKAQSDLAAAQEAAGGGVSSFVASLAGGLVGAMRDPVNVAALAFGGGELKAASTLGQIFEGGIRQAFVNAGAQLMAEPQVQAWRAERGAESGFVPAAEDVGLAALFGAIPGAGFAAARAFIRAGRAPAAIAGDIGKAASGDVEAAARVAQHLPPEIAPDLHAAIDSARLDRAAMPALPEGIAAEDAADAMRGALRHAEDPAQPLGEVPGLARDDLDALLTYETRAMLENGEASPMVVAEVAARTPGFEVWHGSPHEFEAFDATKIGTGEGNAAFGHGLYFAESRGVAQIYQVQLRPTNTLTPEVKGALRQLDYLGFDSAGQALRAIRSHDDWKSRWDVSHDSNAAAIATVDKYIADNPPPRSHLYEARVLRDPSEFLDWEKPLSEQSQRVKDAYRAARGWTADEMRRFEENEADRSGMSLYNDIALSTRKPGDLSQEAASQALSGHGLAGVKYLDQASRAVGEGTRNYVVFSDRDLRILSRNGIDMRAEQASVLREAMQDRPQGRQEAAAAVSNAMERRAVPDAQGAALGADRPLVEVPTAPLSRETNAERAAHVAELEKGLVEPLASAGERDVFGLVPIGEREDGLGMRLLTRDELLAEQPREHALADLVEACKT